MRENVKHRKYLQQYHENGNISLISHQNRFRRADFGDSFSQEKPLRLRH